MLSVATTMKMMKMRMEFVKMTAMAMDPDPEQGPYKRAAADAYGLQRMHPDVKKLVVKLYIHVREMTKQG